MEDGNSKPIEDVRARDRVLATDSQTGRTEAKPVLATITTSGNKNLVKITVDTAGAQPYWTTGNQLRTGAELRTVGTKSALITATDTHPFWVAGDINRWVKATDLKPGMWLRTSSGTYVQITHVKTWTKPDQRVHNLTVADHHTYYAQAGNTSVLVHNCPHLNFDGVPDGAQPYIENVVRQMDADGTLPPGVRQGGSRTGQGIYSGEGLTPQRAPRYYVETDIFPTSPGGRRPDGRLVFGARGEVYYSRHYDDGFVQVRGPSCGC
jgi:hypothetical protein